MVHRILRLHTRGTSITCASILMDRTACVSVVSLVEHCVTLYYNMYNRLGELRIFIIITIVVIVVVIVIRIVAVGARTQGLLELVPSSLLELFIPIGSCLLLA